MSLQTKNILIGVMLAFIAFLIMISFLTYTQSLLVASIVLLVALWTNEAIPLAVVSLLPIILFPAFGILNTKQAAMHYANPIIFLFLGGFLIAIAVEKTDLHKWMAHKMLNFFPKSNRGIIFALIFTSGLLSSLLSNTTTTLLLLPMALFLTNNKKLKIRFALSIAYGASVGGILTPIGTPPNLILFGIIQEMSIQPIAFMQWIVMTIPLVLSMFIVIGFFLGIGLTKEIVTTLEVEKLLTKEQKKILFVIFALILILIANAPIKPFYSGLGLSDAGLLLSAGLILFMPPLNILNWMKDKNKIPLRIMFLFGAGFSIAAAFIQTGLALEVATHLKVLAHLPVILFMLIIATIVTFTTEVTSNTALTSIMLPIIYAVSVESGLDVRLFMMLAAICASYAFMLPIATPPNAIAMSSGVVNIKTMAFFGLIFNIIGVVLIVFIANFFWSFAIRF